jgi:hypothetical protein
VDKTMANRNLLKEAIADAKSVKEAAIANAKAALEEAFTPYLKEKFSAKLAEMEAEDMDEAKEEMDETYSEEGMEDTKTEMDEATDEMDEAKEEMDEMDLDELLAELDEEMGKDEDMEETLNEAEEEEMEMDSEEEEEGEEDDEIDLEDMTEDELKDLIEDVIEDMVRAGELEAGEKFEDDEEDEEEEIDIDVEDEEEIVSEGDKPRKSTAKKEDELLKEEEDMMDEGVIDQLKAVYNDPEFLGKLITVDGKKMSLKDFLAMAGSAAAGGMRKSGAGKGPFNTEGVEEDKRTDAEEEGYLDGMRDEKKDMMKEIEELASTLSETKLLNAKLLYTNKIFRAKNLNETQKVKVLEAFDKATSVRDAKLIYETLTTVKETKTAVTESMRGMASKAAGMAPEKKPILEVNDQFARWQILAGIKRN